MCLFSSLKMFVNLGKINILGHGQPCQVAEMINKLPDTVKNTVLYAANGRSLMDIANFLLNDVIKANLPMIVT